MMVPMAQLRLKVRNLKENPKMMLKQVTKTRKHTKRNCQIWSTSNPKLKLLIVVNLLSVQRPQKKNLSRNKSQKRSSSQWKCVDFLVNPRKKTSENFWNRWNQIQSACHRRWKGLPTSDLHLKKIGKMLLTKTEVFMVRTKQFPYHDTELIVYFF